MPFTTIEQWTGKSQTLAAIFKEADRRGNNNGDIGDDDREREYINQQAEAQKEQLQKEGVVSLWSSSACTGVDFQSGNNNFRMMFDYKGKISAISTNTEDANNGYKAVIGFFGLSVVDKGDYEGYRIVKTSDGEGFLGKIAKYLHIKSHGDVLVPWGSNLMREGTTPGEPKPGCE